MAMVPTAHAGGIEVFDGEDGQILDLRSNPSAIESITRAEIDSQISTAKRYPRSPERFLREAASLVSINQDIAAKCTYTLKRQGKDISGPSVRLAEIVACTWGNLRVVGRVIGDDGEAVTVEGIALDLEKNVGYSLQLRRGVLSSGGRRYSPDMVNMTINASIALVTRNVTFKAVPRAFVSIIHEQAQEVARGDLKTLPTRVRAALDWFGKKGVAESEVYKALEVKGMADIDIDRLMTLNGFRTSISEGHATVEEIFRPAPEPAPQATRQPGESKSDALTRALAGEPAPKADETK